MILFDKILFDRSERTGDRAHWLAFTRDSLVIRPWQPAFPQAMQRHGGKTRPAGPPVAKAETAPRENASDESRDADVGNPAPATTAESKD